MANLKTDRPTLTVGRLCGRVVAAFAMAATIVGCDSETVTTPTVPLVSVASVPAPFSISQSIVLIDDDRACVTNSFEARVRCVDRDGDLVGRFGRKGEGPGEFGLAPKLVRGPNGTVGAISMTRLSVFTPSGGLVDETILPVVFLQPAASAFGTTILGQHFAGGADITPVEIDVASGTVLWERPDIDGIAETECGGVALGVASPTGGWTFPACQRELVFLQDREAPTATLIQSPTYAEELPNERDIAEIEENNRRFLLQTHVDVYRETPKRNHLRVASLAYDDHGRLWVATERDRARFSYFDLYVGTEYVGSVRIKDRLQGYDLHGSTLAALVEREPGADGIGWRAVDWYDIGELDLGLDARQDLVPTDGGNDDDQD